MSTSVLDMSVSVDGYIAGPNDEPGNHVEDLRMRMLHLGLRVTDLERSRAFYSALGYAELGGVPEAPFGSLTMLQVNGVIAEPPTEPGPGIWTSWVTDPDGYRIELVQWPPDHPAGMTAADFVAG